MERPGFFLIDGITERPTDWDMWRQQMDWFLWTNMLNGLGIVKRSLNLTLMLPESEFLYSVLTAGFVQLSRKWAQHLCVLSFFVFSSTKLAFLWSSSWSFTRSEGCEMDIKKRQPHICKLLIVALSHCNRPFEKSSFFCLLLIFMAHDCISICVSSVKLACVCAQQEVGVAQGPWGCFDFTRQMALPCRKVQPARKEGGNTS